MYNQAYVFFIFILNGFIIGIIFDLFRIIRKSFRTKDFITYIQDAFFWIVSSSIVLYSVFKFNNGELRSYIFLGITNGFILYFLIFSKPFISINLLIVSIIKKIINYILVIPVKKIYYFLKIIIAKPIFILTVNISRKMSNIVNNAFFCYKKHKKIKRKKDLA